MVLRCLLVSLVALLGVAPALAQDLDGEDMPVAARAARSVRGDVTEVHRSPHTENTHVIFGLKGAQLTAFRRGEEEGDEPSERRLFPAGGVQAFVETTLVEGLAELEVAVGAFFFADETAIPVDVMLKKPFCFGHVVQVYLGLGVTVAPAAIRQGGSRVTAGGLAAIGTYLWVSESFGFDLELDYALLGGSEGVEHELTAGLGVALRI